MKGTWVPLAWREGRGINIASPCLCPKCTHAPPAIPSVQTRALRCLSRAKCQACWGVPILPPLRPRHLAVFTLHAAHAGDESLGLSREGRDPGNRRAGWTVGSGWEAWAFLGPVPPGGAGGCPFPGLTPRGGPPSRVLARRRPTLWKWQAGSLWLSPVSSLPDPRPSSPRPGGQPVIPGRQDWGRAMASLSFPAVHR